MPLWAKDARCDVGEDAQRSGGVHYLLERAEAGFARFVLNQVEDFGSAEQGEAGGSRNDPSALTHRGLGPIDLCLARSSDHCDQGVVVGGVNDSVNAVVKGTSDGDACSRFHESSAGCRCWTGYAQWARLGRASR